MANFQITKSQNHRALLSLWQTLYDGSVHAGGAEGRNDRASTSGAKIDRELLQEERMRVVRRVHVEKQRQTVPKLNDQSLPLDPIREAPCATHASRHGSPSLCVTSARGCVQGQPHTLALFLSFRLCLRQRSADDAFLASIQTARGHLDLPIVSRSSYIDRKLYQPPRVLIFHWYFKI